MFSFALVRWFRELFLLVILRTKLSQSNQRSRWTWPALESQAGISSLREMSKLARGGAKHPSFSFLSKSSTSKTVARDARAEGLAIPDGYPTAAMEALGRSWRTLSEDVLLQIGEKVSFWKLTFSLGDGRLCMVGGNTRIRLC